IGQRRRGRGVAAGAVEVGQRAEVEAQELTGGEVVVVDTPAAGRAVDRGDADARRRSGGEPRGLVERAVRLPAAGNRQLFAGAAAAGREDLVGLRARAERGAADGELSVDSPSSVP